MIFTSLGLMILLTEASYQVVRLVPPVYPGCPDPATLGSTLLVRAKVPFLKSTATLDRIWVSRPASSGIHPGTHMLLTDSSGRLVIGQFTRSDGLLADYRREGNHIAAKLTAFGVTQFEGDLTEPGMPVLWDIGEAIAFDPHALDVGRRYALFVYAEPRTNPFFHYLSVVDHRWTVLPDQPLEYGIEETRSDGGVVATVNSGNTTRYLSWSHTDRAGRLRELMVGGLHIPSSHLWTTPVPEAEAGAAVAEALNDYMLHKSEYEAIVSSQAAQ